MAAAFLQRAQDMRTTAGRRANPGARYNDDMKRLLLVAAIAAGCGAGTSISTAVGASTVTGAALAASAANRASGGCWAVCTNGTTCNPRTGLCDDVPCRGLCGAEEHCETTYSESKCVPGAPSDVIAASKARQAKLPVKTPEPMPINGGQPTIVPAAEQNPPRQ